MGTESRHPRSIGLDKMSAREIVRLMNEEDSAVLRAVRQAEPYLAQAGEAAARAYQSGGRVVYVGAGTSGRIATADAAEMPPTFGVPPEKFIAIVAGGEAAGATAIESAEDDGHLAIDELERIGLGREDFVICLAASGRTPFVVSAARHAKQKGVKTCGIANNRDSELLEAVDLPILLDTGPEILTGSTRLKAGTAQKLALNAISTSAMVLSGKVVENLMVDVTAKNEKLKERCVQILRELTTVHEDEARRLLESHGWSVRRVLAVVRSSEAVTKG